MSRAGSDTVEMTLVVGATSDIGRVIAYKPVGEGCGLQLAGRGAAGLDREMQDLRVRSGASWEIAMAAYTKVHSTGAGMLSAKTFVEIPAA